MYIIRESRFRPAVRAGAGTREEFFRGLSADVSREKQLIRGSVMGESKIISFDSCESDLRRDEVRQGAVPQ
jgi:hypothetical protein